MGVEVGNRKEQTTGVYIAICISLFIFSFFVLFVMINEYYREEQVPKIELASMDFTVLNITDTRLSAKWDMLIRIPSDLPLFYICPQGDLQASFLYKNVTLVTSSPQRYENLRYRGRQVLRVSAGVLGEDIDGLIAKDIAEDMKEKKEVRFGTRFYLTDCREKKPGTMRYACDEVTLRFEPGSEMKAALFGENPSCVNY